MTCQVVSVTNKSPMSSLSHTISDISALVRSWSFFHTSSMHFIVKSDSPDRTQRSERGVLAWGERTKTKTYLQAHVPDTIHLRSWQNTPHSLSPSPRHPYKSNEPHPLLCDWLISWKWLQLAGWIDAKARTHSRSRRIDMYQSHLGWFSSRRASVRRFISLPSFSPIVCTSHLPIEGSQEGQWLSNYVCVFS